MTPEQLTHENVGKPVTVYLNENFNEARAVIAGWTASKETVYVELSSEYGKHFRSGQRVGVPAESVALSSLLVKQKNATRECGYCGGTGEIAESSTRYSRCPDCGGSGVVKE